MLILYHKEVIYFYYFQDYQKNRDYPSKVNQNILILISSFIMDAEE